MLVDEATITVQAGDGGRGVVHFFPGKNGPDGGDGGKGGDVYAVINPQLVSLYKYMEKKQYKAEDGKFGSSNNMYGHSGEDLILQFPKGVTFRDIATQEEMELTPENSPLLLAKGGYGGKGNTAFKSSINRAPMHAQLGKPGEVHQYKVIMKLIADFGLIGLPNAGKSSLLNELTAAHAKTANYAFTTLEPNLGVLNEKIIADIPGLIEGASKGKGLGTRFLKHIEKVRLLIHCISVESTSIEKDFETVMKELAGYNATESLLKKKMIVLLTKIDLVSPEVVKEKMAILKNLDQEVYPISIHDLDSQEKLKKVLSSI